MSAQITMVTTDETKWVAWGPCSVTHIHGYNPQAGTIYIQLFQTPTVTAGDIPVIKSLLCPAGQNFFFDWDPAELQLSELFVALSSTEATYTAITSNAGLDLTLIVDSDCLVTSTTTIVGDLTTGVADRQVWADSAGPKFLLRLDVKNNDAASRYPFVFAEDSPSSTLSDPAWQGPAIATTLTKTYFFGREGLSPRKLAASGASVADGCTVKLGSSGAKDYTFDAGTDFNIRAIYA